MLKRSGKDIFIHHDGALGDTLLSLPCISLIRQSASYIHLAGRSDVAAFLKETGMVDAVSSVDSAVYSSLYAESMDEKIGRLLSAYDELYLFTLHYDSQFARNMRRISQNVTVIKTIPPEGCNEHVAEYRLRQYGYDREGGKGKTSLCVPEEAMNWAKGLLKGLCYADGRDVLIAVHPGSGGRKKCWPMENYQALITMIAIDPRVICIVLSGPAEDGNTVQALSQLAQNNKRIMHLRHESLIRIAACMGLSDFYIGNDSGISHLAGVLQCRGIVLFGPTDPRLWRPFGDTLEVLRFETEGTVVLSAGQVYARMKSALAPEKTKIDFRQHLLI